MGKTSYRDRQQTRHIKYKTKGKKQTLPIKDEKELHRISKYLLVKRDRAKQKGQLRRYETYYRNYMLFMVAINVGFRTEDLLQLEVGDIIGGHMHIKENKTGKQQIFPLNKKFVQDVQKYADTLGLTEHEYMVMSCPASRSLSLSMTMSSRSIYRVLSISALPASIFCSSSVMTLRL